MTPRDVKVAALAARIHGRQSALAGESPTNRRGEAQAYSLAARAISGDKDARRVVRTQKLALRRALQCARTF